MIPLSLAEVAAVAPGKLEAAEGTDRVTGVTIDSRRVQAGDLFVAVGRGVEFTRDALARGAAAALIPEDAFRALAALARTVRERSSARAVGVTGSIAKTSTKDILGALCRPHRRTVVAEGSQNNEIGLPLTLCRIEEDTEIVILEMGMRGLGQIAALCQTARPDVGVITKIGPVHLELLGTIERVAEAKAELVHALPPGGTAVVPAGDAHLEPYLNRDDVELIRFGTGGDIQLKSFTPSRDESDLEIEAFGRTLTLTFSFASRYNAANALAALAAYHALGLPLDEAYRGAANVKLSRWRGEETPLPGDGLLINDAYNANPLSMSAALEHLAERAGPRRKVAVLGDMAELGPGGPAYHREVGAVAARMGITALVAIGPLARGFLEGARGVPETRWAPTVEEGLVALRSLLRPGDCVLVKGSRAMGLEAIADALAVVPVA
ncbi:MAG: UDP-N-acetylmuramoyl-tripeptide--D-alanyl-D-alanine ligase [Actinomycetota bacterium]|nr:UDP-N-acetylmuramoyl-tripeptide--D-alanyl-D-alanine ligase [Actinomycetota bacterium]